jgi:hypothetical protein
MYHHIRFVPQRLPRAKRVGWLVRACSDGEMVNERTTEIIYYKQIYMYDI